jgi:hypothetical protein
MKWISKLKNQNQNSHTNRRKPKALLPQWISQKSIPFTSAGPSPFIGETSGLFTYQECPRVKRIKTECARLFLGSLRLSLYVTGAPWRHAANRGAFLVITTCACREKTSNLLESPLSPGTSLNLKHKSQPNLNVLNVRDDETPPAKPRL